MKVYFSDIFEVSPKKLEEYGALNISLVNDLPLFIDPFLLFNSKKPLYKKLHKQILKYVAFLRDKSIGYSGNVGKGLLRSWYTFPEIKQNWLGFSKGGNEGRGPGIAFAKSLNENLTTIFKDFDKTKIATPHLEKLCLIKENIGKDNISDFVTNLIHAYLLEYTEKFAKKHLNTAKFCKKFSVYHVRFCYETNTWTTESFLLPFFKDAYVLLTPKDILTKNDTWINRNDLFNDFSIIANSIENASLRDQLNNYFISKLPIKLTKKGKRKENTQQEKAIATGEVIRKYPDFLDYYLKYKEVHGKKAQNISKSYVDEVEDVLIKKLSKLIDTLEVNTNFYKEDKNTIEGTYNRIIFLKDIIENKGGYRTFYHGGNPITRESDLHILFRLTWFGSHIDINQEVNNGRGQVDFKASKGSNDITLAEFKLASNPQLENNLQHQLEIYKKANNTKNGYKVIFFFSAEEEENVYRILKSLKMDKDPNIILIDARRDNKPSASRAKSH